MLQSELAKRKLLFCFFKFPQISLKKVPNRFCSSAAVSLASTLLDLFGLFWSSWQVLSDLVVSGLLMHIILYWSLTLDHWRTDFLYPAATPMMQLIAVQKCEPLFWSNSALPVSAAWRSTEHDATNTVTSPRVVRAVCRGSYLVLFTQSGFFQASFYHKDIIDKTVTQRYDSRPVPWSRPGEACRPGC